MKTEKFLYLFLYWLPTILWMAVIFYLSAQTGPKLESAFPFIDDFNIGHPIAYFILGLTFYFSLTRTMEVEYPYVWVLVFVFIYGLSDEFHQSFVPGRNPDIHDLARDIFGGVLAVGAIKLKKKFFKPR